MQLLSYEQIQWERNLLSNLLSGIFQKNIRKNVSMFLNLPHCSLEAEVVGERVNRGGGYGLGIPVLYHFLGPAKATLVKK